MISKDKIDEVMTTMSKRFSLKRIFLFGSYAYGKPTSESDLDVCVITDLGGKRKIDLIRDIRREISSYVQYPMDILLYEENEFDERATLKNTLEHKILRTGILING